MLTLLFGFFLKESGDTGESDVIAGEVGIERVVDIAYVVFNVDLFIDGSFAFRGVIDTSIRGVDRGLVNYCKLGLYGIKGLENDTSDFCFGGTRHCFRDKDSALGGC